MSTSGSGKLRAFTRRNPPPLPLQMRHQVYVHVSGMGQGSARVPCSAKVIILWVMHIFVLPLALTSWTLRPSHILWKWLGVGYKASHVCFLHLCQSLIGMSHMIMLYCVYSSCTNNSQHDLFSHFSSHTHGTAFSAISHGWFAGIWRGDILRYLWTSRSWRHHQHELLPVWVSTQDLPNHLQLHGKQLHGRLMHEHSCSTALAQVSSTTGNAVMRFIKW